MMDGVEAPEEREPMKAAVDPVLGEIGQRQHREKLDRQRQRSEQREISRRDQRVSDQPGGKQRRPAERLHEQMADQEMSAVRGPLRPEDPLFGTVRKRALERHEYERKHEQVDRKPLEAQAE